MKRSLYWTVALIFLSGGALFGETHRGVEGTAGVVRLPGELEVRAMAEAYPGRVAEVAVKEGEWALLMDGVWYYWADGRLLPEEHRGSAEEFASIRFYTRYRFGPAVDREIPPDLAERLRDRGNVGAGDERSRFNGFLDKLYQVSSRGEAEARMERVSFLGVRTRVHPLVVEPLQRVERRILAVAESNPEVRRFSEGLSSIHGYNWRNIAGTNRRSYHSYGIAVDLLPAEWSGRWAYWLWADTGGVGDWWSIPVKDRWQVPQPIIDAFEAEGFVWGGKWLFFDNIHFEYRPESIVLARWRWAYDFTRGWFDAEELRP